MKIEVKFKNNHQENLLHSQKKVSREIKQRNELPY